MSPRWCRVYGDISRTRLNSDDIVNTSIGGQAGSAAWCMHASRQRWMTADHLKAEVNGTGKISAKRPPRFR